MTTPPEPECVKNPEWIDEHEFIRALRTWGRQGWAEAERLDAELERVKALYSHDTQVLHNIGTEVQAERDAALARVERLEAILEKTEPTLDEAMDLLSWLKHDAYTVIKGDYNGKIPCCQHDGEVALGLIRAALADKEGK